MDEIEYIRSNKGGQKIIYKGYMYTVHKNKKCGGIRWRCAQRSLNCKGSISTTSLGVPYLNIPHNHLPDSHSAAVARSKVFDPTPLDFHSFLNLLIHEQPIEQTSEVPGLPMPFTNTKKFSRVNRNLQISDSIKPYFIKSLELQKKALLNVKVSK